MAQTVKYLPAMPETQVQFLEHLRYKGMAPHSSLLAWRIPQTEEPGGLQSMGSQRVGHERLTLLPPVKLRMWKRAELSWRIVSTCARLVHNIPVWELWEWRLERAERARSHMTLTAEGSSGDLTGRSQWRFLSKGPLRTEMHFRNGIYCTGNHREAHRLDGC